MTEEQHTAQERVKLELNTSPAPGAEFQKGTLLLSFSAYIALFYFKGASKETGFIRGYPNEGWHGNPSSTVSAPQADNHVTSEQNLGWTGAGALSLYLYANIQGYGAAAPAYLNNANKNQAVFVLLLRPIPCSLSQNLSLGTQLQCLLQQISSRPFAGNGGSGSAPLNPGSAHNVLQHWYHFWKEKSLTSL